MIDWILAERIAGYLAGTGNGRLPDADLAALAAESEARVTAYTGLRPAQPAARARGDQPQGVGREQHHLDARAARPGARAGRRGHGPAAPGDRARRRDSSSATEVGVVLGYLAQRVLGQYELVLLDEAVGGSAAAAAVRAAQPWAGGAGVRRRGAGVHDLGGAARGDPRGPVRRRAVAARPSWPGWSRELLRSAEVRIDTPRKLRMPSGRRVPSGGPRAAPRRLHLARDHHAERETLDRVQAVMAVIEGHAEHVMDAVAPDLLPSLPQAARGARPAPHDRNRGCRGWWPGCWAWSSSCASTSRASSSATPSCAPRARGAAHGVLEPRGAADAGRARGPGSVDGAAPGSRQLAGPRARSALQRV